jgi:hypothetical protein
VIWSTVSSEPGVNTPPMSALRVCGVTRADTTDAS